MADVRAVAPPTTGSLSLGRGASTTENILKLIRAIRMLSQ
jgi:hypothetical protein